MTVARAPEISARVMSLHRRPAEDRKADRKHVRFNHPGLCRTSTAVSLCRAEDGGPSRKGARECAPGPVWSRGVFGWALSGGRDNGREGSPALTSSSHEYWKRQIIREAAYRRLDKFCNEKKDWRTNSRREARNTRKKRTSYPMTGVSASCSLRTRPARSSPGMTARTSGELRHAPLDIFARVIDEYSLGKMAA